MLWMKCKYAIGKYVITDIVDADQFLIKNYDTKGDLSRDIVE